MGPHSGFRVVAAGFSDPGILRKETLGVQGFRVLHRVPFLGRALGHFIFSLIGPKRILFTNIFQKL